MSKVAVIDYGMGNLHSISKALQHAAPDVEVIVTNEPEQILTAERVVFPGVGAIGDCMQALNESGLADVIKEVATNKPLLGICLGMQALLSRSEESNTTECLNLFSGSVVHFEKGMTDVQGELLKIPHMGWNQVKQHPHPLWENIPDNSRFYFVHSYYAQPNDETIIAATTEYPKGFACALAKDNVFAVQFHPEKSQTVGLQLLQNFLQWNGETA
ncbi:MAG: imidazole glycerol phosphate synthase subunit HisH [Methylococcaceae bacterium]|nr:imidazole glycerol phosphate synthase subunit HisH [Methylococcaceae bacterium]